MKIFLNLGNNLNKRYESISFFIGQKGFKPEYNDLEWNLDPHIKNLV
jgi:hypothetical protein